MEAHFQEIQTLKLKRKGDSIHQNADCPRLYGEKTNREVKLTIIRLLQDLQSLEMAKTAFFLTIFII